MAGPALVQSKPGTASSATSLTITLGATTTAGNCLAVCVMTFGSGTAPTVSGITLGGSADNFAKARGQAQGATNGVDCETWTDQGCAGGQTSVVITLSGSAGNILAWVMEWSGILAAGAVDQVNSGPGATTSWSSGSSGSLAQASEVVIGAVAAESLSFTLSTPGAPWTELAQQSGGFGPVAILGAGYQVVSATTAQAYSGTMSSAGNNAAVIVTLKAAATGPPPDMPQVRPGPVWQALFKPWLPRRPLAPPQSPVPPPPPPPTPQDLAQVRPGPVWQALFKPWLPKRPMVPPSGPSATQPAACGSTIASPGLLPGNLLPPADSDFETWTGDWTAVGGTTIGQSAVTAFCGCESLVMIAAAAGQVSATSQLLPAAPAAGYIASGYLNTQAAAATGYITVSFWTLGGVILDEEGGQLLDEGGGTIVDEAYGAPTQISSPSAAPVTLTAGSWTPVTAAQAAPAGTQWITITFTVTGLASGQAAFLDLAYAAASPAQVLVAWPTLPASAAPLFCDVTPWVRADKGLRITRGRTDEVSEVQASKLTVTLDNTTGWFTVANPGSPWSPGVLIGRRTQVNEADQTGTWHTRFDGTLTDLPVTWAGGPALEALTPAAASGVLAKLGRAPALRTMLEHEMLYDAPMCLYTLAGPSGSAQAPDSSGNGAPPLIPKNYGAGTLAFGSGSPIVEAGGGSTSPVTSVLCTPQVTGAGPSGNLDVQLEASLPSPVTAAAGFTFEIWFTGFTTISNTDLATWYAIAVGDPRSGAMLAVSVQGGNAGTPPALTLVYTADIYSTSPVFTTASLSNPLNGFPDFQPGILAVTVSGTTATLWYNWPGSLNAVAQITIPAGLQASYLTVGGPLGGTQGWQGSLNCAAVWPSALSSARLQAHYLAGLNAYEGDYVYQLIGNVTRYAGLPSWQLALPSAGVSKAGLYSLCGQGPLAALQTYEQVDGGVLYENAAGQLAYQDRSARYAAQAAAAPVLQLAAGRYEPDLLPSITDQFLINDCTTGTTVLAAAGTTTVTAWARAVNQASVASYGTYPDGTPQSPKTGPYYTLSYYDQSLNVCQDAASWITGTCSVPGPRSPVVTVDLLTQPSLRAAVLGAEIGTMLQLQGLPAQYPGGTRPAFMLIEGVTDTLKWDGSGAQWTVVFNTSPSMQSGAWLAGDTAMGVLDLTAVTGRGSDGQTSGRTGALGAPYAVPSFSTTMNGTGNVGAEDMRGITANLQQALTPPVACALQQSLAQSIPANTTTAVEWDTIAFDTAFGFNLASVGNAASPVYTFPLAGTWLVTATIGWLAASGDILTVIIGLPNALPTSSPSVILAEQTIAGVSSGATSQQVSVTVAPTLPWLAVYVSHTGAGALTLDNATGGCQLSLVYLGNT